MLLRKPPAPYEVYNDLDGDVVGFFRVLRERPDDLLRAITLTPFARAEVDLACAPAPDGLDEVERARRVYVRAWQGRHGLPARGRMGWRFERAATRSRTAVDDWRDVKHLVAVVARLREVQLECDDALRVIARFDGPDTVTMSDPPYPAATRWRGGPATPTPTSSPTTATAGWRTSCTPLRGMAVVSGYPCPLYRELYGDWATVTRAARTHGARAATEALWLSPRAAARLPARQLRLLGSDADGDRTPVTEAAG